MHPPLTTRRLNTAIKVIITGMLHLMYNGHIHTSHNYYYTTPSLYFFYTSGQAGWPRTLMSGTVLIPATTFYYPPLLLADIPTINMNS
jgi:hypothetical protein